MEYIINVYNKVLEEVRMVVARQFPGCNVRAQPWKFNLVQSMMELGDAVYGHHNNLGPEAFVNVERGQKAEELSLKDVFEYMPQADEVNVATFVTCLDIRDEYTDKYGEMDETSGAMKLMHFFNHKGLW